MNVEIYPLTFRKILRPFVVMSRNLGKANNVTPSGFEILFP